MKHLRKKIIDDTAKIFMERLTIMGFFGRIFGKEEEQEETNPNQGIPVDAIMQKAGKLPETTETSPSVVLSEHFGEQDDDLPQYDTTEETQPDKQPTQEHNQNEHLNPPLEEPGFAEEHNIVEETPNIIEPSIAETEENIIFGETVENTAIDETVFQPLQDFDELEAWDNPLPEDTENFFDQFVPPTPIGETVDEPFTQQSEEQYAEEFVPPTPILEETETNIIAEETPTTQDEEPDFIQPSEIAENSETVENVGKTENIQQLQEFNNAENKENTPTLQNDTQKPKWIKDYREERDYTGQQPETKENSQYENIEPENNTVESQIEEHETLIGETQEAVAQNEEHYQPQQQQNDDQEIIENTEEHIAEIDEILENVEQNHPATETGEQKHNEPDNTSISPTNGSTTIINTAQETQQHNQEQKKETTAVSLKVTEDQKPRRKFATITKI